MTRRISTRLLTSARRLVITMTATAVLLVSGSYVAHANSWGPRSSWYNGEVVVSGFGYQNRVDNGSYATVTAVDKLKDGNDIYAKTRWERLTEYCISFGASKVVEGSVSVCSVSSRYFDSISRTRTGDSTVPIVATKTQSWCDENGTLCAYKGLKSISYACAQMGWPVPDSCTYASVEFHLP